MQAFRNALIGALLLFVALSVTSCGTAGPKKPPVIVKETELVQEVRRQYVPIPEELTEQHPLPPLPRPAKFDQGQCVNGCYSNKQFDDLIDALKDVISRQWDQLIEIRNLSDEAVKVND